MYSVILIHEFHTHFLLKFRNLSYQNINNYPSEATCTNLHQFLHSQFVRNLTKHPLPGSAFAPATTRDVNTRRDDLHYCFVECRKTVPRGNHPEARPSPVTINQDFLFAPSRYTADRAEVGGFLADSPRTISSNLQDLIRGERGCEAYPLYGIGVAAKISLPLRRVRACKGVQTTTLHLMLLIDSRTFEPVEARSAVSETPIYVVCTCNLLQRTPFLEARFVRQCGELSWLMLSAHADSRGLRFWWTHAKFAVELSERKSLAKSL